MSTANEIRLPQGSLQAARSVATELRADGFFVVIDVDNTVVVTGYHIPSDNPPESESGDS